MIIYENFLFLEQNVKIIMCLYTSCCIFISVVLYIVSQVYNNSINQNYNTYYENRYFM